jgi:hypothetical protein
MSDDVFPAEGTGEPVDSLAVDEAQIRIVESYRDYRSPFDVAQAIRELLKTVPEKYIRGLDLIALMNEASLPRKDRLGKVRTRKRKVDKSRILGRYHAQWQGQRPWIEIRVDKTLTTYPKFLLWFPFGRELCLGSVFYHELGHHVHYFIRPEYREKEDVADDWGNRFMANHVRKKYWYAVWPITLISKIRRFVSAPKPKVH